MTYGDGVCDVDINKLLEFHQTHGKIATLTAVLQDQSKGVLDIGGDNAVKSFREKSISDGAPINAGYMVLGPEIFNYIEGDNTVFEKEPLERLAEYSCAAGSSAIIRFGYFSYISILPLVTAYHNDHTLFFLSFLICC